MNETTLKNESELHTDVKNYTVQASPISYTEKPDPKTEVPAIQKSVITNTFKGTKEELGEILVNGHSVSTGILKPHAKSNSDVNVMHNEVVMVDFDNGRTKENPADPENPLPDPDPELLDKVRNNPWIKENVAFLYETFSSEDGWPRFRAVIFLTEALDGSKVVATLQHVYDQLEETGIDRAAIDTGAHNPARLFHGSQAKQYIDVDMANEWEPQQKELPKHTPKATAVLGRGDAIENDEGLDIIEAYYNVCYDELVADPSRQNHYMDAMYTLYGNYSAGEISEQQALDYAGALAGDNFKWADDNEQRMAKMIAKNESPKEVFSFRDKFQKVVAERDTDSEIAKDYQRRLNAGRTDQELLQLKADIKQGKKQLREDNVRTVEREDGTKEEHYADDQIVIIRDEFGKIVDVKTSVSIGDKQVGQYYDQFADVIANITSANYTNGSLYVRPVGKPYWTSDNYAIRRIINDNVGRLTTARVAEVRAQLEMSATTYGENSNRVQLANDCHLDDGEVVEGWTDKYTPYYMDVDYDPDAYSKDVDDFLDFISEDDPEMRLFFEEMIGHILLRNNKDQRLFFLADRRERGNTGKSTLGEMLTNFVDGEVAKGGNSQNEAPVGKPKMSKNMQIDEFEDQTSALSIASKMMNFGDETPLDYLKNTATIKTIASGGFIDKRGAYARDTTSVTPTATIIFATNGMPDIADKTGGMARRVSVVHFDRRPSDAGIKRDLQLKQKLSTREAQSYILNLGLKGVASMKSIGREMHIPDTVRIATEKYMVDNDPVTQYVEEAAETSNNSLTGRDLRIVFNEFKDWCAASGYATRSRKTFESRMLALGYDVQQSTKNITMMGTVKGRPMVFVKSSDAKDKYSVLFDFIKKNDITDRYWQDVYFQYVEYSEKEGVAPLKLNEFNTSVTGNGYVKKKAPKLFANADGTEGRHMIYTKAPDKYGNPFK